MLRAAIAAMRPDIAAEPMLRAPRPEMTPASSVAFAASCAVGGCAGYDVAAFGPAIATRCDFPDGKRKTSSAMSTLTSAFSTMMRLFFGRSFGPDSYENGIHT